MTILTPRTRAVAALAAATLGLLSSATWSLWRLDSDWRGEADRQLTRIAEDQAQGIAAWRTRTLTDAEVIAAAAEIGKPAPDTLRVGAFSEASRYALDGSGKQILWGTARSASSVADTPGLVRACREARRPILGEPRRDTEVAQTHIDVAVPVWESASRHDAPSAVVVLSLNADETLFPMLRWPLSTRTGESLLVRRDGDEVTYLNAPRHAGVPPLTLARPMDAALPAARALMGTRGLVSGSDYRGTSVRAYLLAVPHSRWTLVAKIDAEEVSARTRAVASFGGAGAAVSLLLAAYGLVSILATRRAAEARRLSEAESKWETISRHYEYLARYSNDAMILSDSAGRLVEVNERACSLYGYSREEFLGRFVDDLRPTDLRSTPETTLDAAGSTDGLLYETRHVRSDGTVFDAEVSQRAIIAKGGTYFQAVVRDVSERTRTDAERARLAAMVEASLNEVYVFDPTSLRFSYVNAGARQNLGYDAEQLRGMTPLDLKPDFDTVTFHRQIAPLLEDRERQIVFETRHRRADGTHYPVEVRLQLVEHGHERHFLAIIVDTTARRQSDEALKESEEKYRELWNAESDALFLVESQSGRILDANPAAERLYGYSREELLTMRNVDVSADPDGTSQAGASMATRIPVRRHRRRDGTVFSVEISAGRLEWRGRPVHLAAIRDITERLSREQALRMAEERSSALLLAIPDTFLLIDVDGHIVDYRSRAGSVLLMDPEHFLGREIQDVLPAEATDRLLPALVRAWETGEVQRVEFPLPVPGAPSRTQEARLARTTIGDLIAIIRDVTEERHAEAALRESQKTESLGTLAGGVAHDFNNILGSALPRLGLARSALSETHPAFRHVDKAILAVERAATLARQMLDYSGKGHFQVEHLSLADLVKDSLGLLQAGVSSAIRIESRLEPSLPLVAADRRQIQQILANLVTNAAEATGASAGAIAVSVIKRTLSAADSAFWTHTSPPATPTDYVILEVRDCGHGMDAETITRIFDPFFSTKSPGRGLGLPVILGIVRGHEGGIAVESRPGVGTRIEIALPVADA